MAHKTLIGGTAYEIGGGKTLVGGTAYSIDKGKTLVGGTVYGIEFTKMATLTIGYFTTNHYSISVDGVVYNDTTLTVPVGTIVEIEVFDIYGDCKHHDSNVSIYVNDNCVMDNDTNTTYSHTVTGDTALSNEMYYNTCHDCYRYYYQYNVYITEVPDGYVLLKVLGYAGNVSVDGTYYYDGDYIVVPVGTIVTLENYGYAAEDKESYIDVNDTRVLEGCGSYDYTATTNATIELANFDAGDGRYYYRIYVTEE